MSHSDYFWLGFTVCWFFIMGIAMTFILLVRSVELAKMKSELNKKAGK